MKTFVVTGLCVIGWCMTASAQESVERFERTAQQIQRDTQATVDRNFPLNQRALIDYGGYFTFSYLSFDDASHDNHALRNYELVGYGHLNFDGVHEFYTRGRSYYRNYNPGDAVDDTADRLQGRVEEGWYRFDLQRYESAYKGRTIQGDIAVKGGRQFVSWGNGLTLDQYVDGISANIRYDNKLELSVLGCVTVRETIDFDISRPNFFDNTHRGFYGANLALPLGRIKPYAFFLLERDYNSTEPLDAHVIPTQYNYNSYYAGAGANGTVGDHLSYAGEFCFEGGHDLSNSFNASTNEPVHQTYDRIEAYAGDLRLDYLPNDKRRTRVSAEGIIASGDNDRILTSTTFAGNRPTTVDHAFNSLGVRYLGFAFAPALSNVLVFRIGASTFPLPQTKPFRQLQIGGDFFIFGKATQNAPIDESTSNHHYLGVEPDIFANWQITEDLTLAVRYGIFFPGAAIPSGAPDHLRQFLYTGVTYAF